jgi:phosphopantothenate synthetase
VKILTLKDQKIKLTFEQGKIKKAIKNVNGNDVHLNAKAIRKITQVLQAKSTQVNRVSYRTKRNVQKNIEKSINRKLHGQYTYTNDYKTQFTIIVNK